MAPKIEEINVVHINNISSAAKKIVMDQVNKKQKAGTFDFKDYVEIRMVSQSPMRVASMEPIEGTDVDWMKRQNQESGIDTSDIF